MEFVHTQIIYNECHYYFRFSIRLLYFVLGIFYSFRLFIYKYLCMYTFVFFFCWLGWLNILLFFYFSMWRWGQCHNWQPIQKIGSDVRVAIIFSGTRAQKNIVLLYIIWMKYVQWKPKNLFNINMKDFCIINLLKNSCWFNYFF